jgi:hypothetical protein
VVWSGQSVVDDGMYVSTLFSSFGDDDMTHE